MKNSTYNGSGVTIDRSQVFGEKFSNVAEFYDYIESHPIKDEFKRYGEPSSIDGSWDWTGTRSYEDATSLLLNGDPDAKRLIDGSGVAANMRQVNRVEMQRTTVLAPCGFLPHVPNFLAGRPNNMIAERVTIKRKKVINVAYNIAALGSASSTDMLNAAINVLNAILRCEAGGLRINLWAVAISSSRKNYAVTAVRIKDSRQYIDVMKMAYPMTNPSMFRRHVFRFREVLPDLPTSFADGYGCTVSDVDIMHACLEHLNIDVDAVFGFYQANSMSQEQIMDLITQVNK